MGQILLSTINARYIHTSIGLRYLFANLNELQSVSSIREYDPTKSVESIAEEIINSAPKILGLGVYIWNAGAVSKLVVLLKEKSSSITIVLGGPEVSHFPVRVNFDKADYVIAGEGEIEFYNLCKKILHGENVTNRLITAAPVNLDELELPYQYYSKDDIANRVIYIEASRGCPFTCEFCLSSIDKYVRYFDVRKIVGEIEKLWERGARKYKFADRTFNLDINYSIVILDYFLAKKEKYFLHFEFVPQNIPDNLKEKIMQFPPASLQLEIGIQTLNEEVAYNIKRKLDISKIEENILFIKNKTKAHMHLDLIVGLPGESMESFGENLNRLVELTNAEIQIGILKKLSGTTISRHDTEHGMIYSQSPPYEIIQNQLMPPELMQKMKRFARYWDLYYNSGNFNESVKLLWYDNNAFNSFFEFSNWLFVKIGTTWKIQLNILIENLFVYLTTLKGIDKYKVAELIVKDFTKVEGRKIPKYLKDLVPLGSNINSQKVNRSSKRQIKRL